MLFKELHEKFDSPIKRAVRNRSQSDLQSFLYSNVKHFVDKYAVLYSHEYLQKLQSFEWNGIKDLANQERDLLDRRANSSSSDTNSEMQLEGYELAGIVLEMTGYLNDDPIDETTLFNYIYCWGVFVDDEFIIRKLNGLISNQGMNFNLVL